MNIEKTFKAQLTEINSYNDNLIFDLKHKLKICRMEINQEEEEK